MASMNTVGTSFIIRYCLPDKWLRPSINPLRRTANHMWNHVIPKTDAAFTQGQTIDQSTIPGVNTKAKPNTQVAIIAGFMIAFKSNRS